jgi:hypothetical protein
MNDTERQELIDRLDKAEKQLNTGFTESGRELTVNEAAIIRLFIKTARNRLGVVL